MENQEFGNRLNKLELEIQIIKDKLGEDNWKEKELTDWAKEELEEARKRNNKISHEEVKKMVLEK